MNSTRQEAYWSLAIKDAMKEVIANKSGLSNKEAASRLKKYGLNTFKARPRSSSLILFLL